MDAYFMPELPLPGTTWFSIEFFNTDNTNNRCSFAPIIYLWCNLSPQRTAMHQCLFETEGQQGVWYNTSDSCNARNLRTSLLYSSYVLCRGNFSFESPL